MTVLCAWCTPRERTAELVRQGETVSHTLCESCAARLYRDMDRALSAQAAQRGLGWGWLLFPCALLVTCARRVLGACR